MALDNNFFKCNAGLKAHIGGMLHLHLGVLDSEAEVCVSESTVYG